MSIAQDLGNESPESSPIILFLRVYPGYLFWFLAMPRLPRSSDERHPVLWERQNRGNPKP